MERYEWVVIRHPELASSIKTQEQEDTASSEGQNSADVNSLQQPEKPAGDLSPFLSARHFNLNSKNTSMFMAGNFDSIVIGEWIFTVLRLLKSGQTPTYIWLLSLVGKGAICTHFLVRRFPDRCVYLSAPALTGSN